MKKTGLLFRLLILAAAFIFATDSCWGQTQTFTSSGTFIVPPGVTSIIVECWGAGGAGGGSSANNNGGSGGGGGGYCINTLTVTPGQVINYTVGTGNNGTVGNGLAGGNTSFLTVIATGGGGGGADKGAIGVGGSGSGGTSTVGGNGTLGTNRGNAGGAGANGGAGGAGNVNNSNGNPGTAPGGAGGGGENTGRVGGAGANGQVIVSWVQPIYYSQASGDPNLLSNWKTSIGYSPSGFSDNWQTFVIRNGHTMTTSLTGWTVSGINTIVQIQSGGTLTETTDISLSASTILQVDNGGSINHNVNSISLFGGTESFGNSSTVTYGFTGAQTVVAGTYGNLILSGSDAKTITGITVNGVMSIEETALTAGSTPTYGATSTLQYKGSVSQSSGIELPATLYNLTINNPFGVSLSASVTVNNILTMTQGNIAMGANTITLISPTSSNLAYNSGTIIGKLQRAIGATGTLYLYPVGTATTYNPLKITFSNLTTGQLAVQFLASDIGVAGLPIINDSGADIYDRQTTGYWSLTAIGTMASTNYSVNLNYTGFTGVDANARILKRTNGGNLVVNGTHGTVSSPEITRTALNGISTTTTDFGIGKPNPRFTTQPSNISGCTGSFNVVVSGKATITYRWQENNGGGFVNLNNGGLYSGATTSTLTITGATIPMNGYLYRCVVTDGSGYTSTSSNATIVLPIITFGYKYSMDITLSPASGTSDLTDFPALINITSSLLKTTGNGGHTSNSSGFDIIFTDVNGNKLDHQIEYYDATTGNYVAWVRIPVLSRSASNTISMYYGNPSVAVNPSVKSVWTSSYKGVWHLNGTDYTDATTNLNNGTNNNTTNVTGKIAGGRGFNGTNAYIQVPTNGFVPNDNNQTISIWANYPAIPGGNANLISFQAGQSGSAIQLGFRGGHAVAWEWGGTILADGGLAPSINTWHYYVYTYDGTTSQIYIDGVFKGSSTVAPQTLLPTEGNIGRYNAGEYINANLDEPRFSMSPKSAGWIQTEYNNQNDPASFISLGTEVNATLLGTIGVCSTTYTLSQGLPSGGVYSGPGVTGTNFNASVAGVGTHSITYLYTDGLGCSNSAVKNIIVTPIPTAPAASNIQCCISNILDLEAIGTNIKWYSNSTLTTLVGTGTPFATGRTTAGVYTYYATQTLNGCESTATTVTLTILSGIAITTQPLPTSICTSGSGNFSVVATGFNLTYQWQEAGVNISDAGIYSGTTSPSLTITNPTIAKNGLTYICVVSSSCGTSPLNSTGALLTVTTLPAATISYAGTPFCKSVATAQAVTRTGTAGGTYSASPAGLTINAGTGAITPSTSTAGTYTVTYTIAAAGGCGIVTATTSVTITTLPIATFSYSATPYCSDAANPLPTFSGGGVAGVFSSTAGLSFISTGTGQINLTTTTPGTYTVTNTIAAAGGCGVVTATTSVTITTLPVATISYTGSPFCTSVATAQAVNRTGTAGGTYSASPAGLTINAGTGAITPSTSTAGTYTVTYTIAAAGGCGTVTATTSVTITALPVATFSYTGTPYCSNAANPTPTFSGGGIAGVFTSIAGLNFISAATGQVNLATSTPGTYTVTNTIAAAGGCAIVTATSTITITALPAATISYSGSPWCYSTGVQLVTLIGTSGGTFSSTAGLTINSSTGSITPLNSIQGVYTVTYTIAAYGGCGDVIATTSVEISAANVWSGAVSTDWNVAGNWSCGGVPGASSSVTIPDVPNKPVLGAGLTASVNNLTISAGSSLTISDNTIQISGTITNGGTFTSTNGTIEFNGSAPQVIGAGTFTGSIVKDLTVNNPTGVTLLAPLDVTGIVKLTSGNFASDGNLTLLSTASGTALTDGSGTGNITGNVTMQRYLPDGFGYKYFSSPFQAANVGEFSDDMMSLNAGTFYKYDENRTSSGWVSYSIATNPLVQLSGYAVNFGNSHNPRTVDVTGQVNNGNISVTLQNHNYTYTKGFSLAGNPYPSPIDWDLVSPGNINIDNAIYLFKASPADQYAGTYSSYVGGTGVSTGGTNLDIIPSMQGFFVHVSNGPPYPVTGTLNMTNSVRIVNFSQPFAAKKGTESKSEVNLLRLTARYSDDMVYADPMVIYFDEKGTPEFDGQLDALKLLNTDLQTPNLYSVASDGMIMSINAIPNITTDFVQVPLGLKLNRTAGGTIKFKLQDIDPSLTYMRIYISDINTGAEQDLLPDQEYTVTLAKGEYLNRFYLNISNITTSSQEITNKPEMFRIYSSGNLLKAEVTRLDGVDGTITIFNISGQKLLIKKVHEPGYYEFETTLMDGIYLVNFKSGTFTLSKKLFIQSR